MDVVLAVQIKRQEQVETGKPQAAAASVMARLERFRIMSLIVEKPGPGCSPVRGFCRLLADRQVGLVRSMHAVEGKLHFLGG